jgi:uncharacterized protein
MSVTRIRNLSPRPFAGVKYFPGTTGNPFDLFLHAFGNLERIPVFVFLLLFALLAFLGGKFDLLYSGFLFLFILSDWLLIAFLPVSRRSFGPVKPVVLALALLRTVFFLLPNGWNLALEFIGTLLVIYGFYIETFRLEIHSETFSTTKLAVGQHLRVVHLGDLHVERTTRREKAVLRALTDLSPDLILFSGDILNLSYLEDAQAQADARAFLSALSAPLGVYGVAGSPAVDLPELFPRLVENTPLRWLDGEAAKVNVGDRKLTIYGLSCSHNPDVDSQALEKMLHGSPMEQGSFNILLYHSPDLAPGASHYGFDLQLSGHTHGGQVRLPLYGALYTGSLYKKAFEAGRYLVNGMTLYVTRGLGMEGAIAPRVRVLCRPELIVWDICNQ